uniref:hypothetical protein n=1 Tax=Cyanobium sp. TaxID=2164130 RepID=UPI00404847E2
MVASRPLPTPSRPELSDQLLAAVAERDRGLANRLLQQWVHRRGLPSLEAWILGHLASSQGPGASDWLHHCLGDSAQEPMAALETAPIEPASIEPSLVETVAIAQALPDAPAPAPASLAALRAWLPDRSDDLPLAG